MITIYYSDSCFFCKHFIEELKKKNIKFELKDISLSVNAQEHLLLNPSGEVPTTVITNNNVRSIIIGADIARVIDYIQLSSNNVISNSSGQPKDLVNVASCPTDDRGNILCSCLGLTYKQDRRCCVSNPQCGSCYNGSRFAYCYK